MPRGRPRPGKSPAARRWRSRTPGRTRLQGMCRSSAAHPANSNPLHRTLGELALQHVTGEASSQSVVARLEPPTKIAAAGLQAEPSCPVPQLRTRTKLPSTASPPAGMSSNWPPKLACRRPDVLRFAQRCQVITDRLVQVIDGLHVDAWSRDTEQHGSRCTAVGAGGHGQGGSGRQGQRQPRAWQRGMLEAGAGWRSCTAPAARPGMPLNPPLSQANSATLNNLLSPQPPTLPAPSSSPPRLVPSA
jgi:hypothetical protein